ncbi:hypothetical protein ANRL2_00838 [Anaerolineae bacterium]|nr:hypothetical protein ANRL2_00838 [Anaerolineae bacterium]
MPQRWQAIAIGWMGVMIGFNILMASLSLLGLRFLEALFVTAAGLVIAGYIGFQVVLRKS